MVHILTSVKNTFVHAQVDSTDHVEKGGNARRRASSTPSRVIFDAAEIDTCDAHVFGAHELEEFPRENEHHAPVHTHAGPYPLDMDGEGALGCRVSETDVDHFWGLSVSQPMHESTLDFVNLGKDIDDTLSKVMGNVGAQAPACHGLMCGTQMTHYTYRESLAQKPLCLSTAPMTAHTTAQRQLFSTSPIPPHEDQRDSYPQVYSRDSPQPVLCNEKHDEIQGEEMRTTVMLMNLPLGYTNSKLMRTINSEGFANTYDFIYVPKAAGYTSKGYAFVNLVNPSIAQRFVTVFNGFSKWSTTSKNVCNAVWAKTYQGLQANIDRYRNSSVMGKSVPYEHKPRIFHYGVEMPFPPPNGKPIRPTRRGGQSGKTNEPQALPL